MNAEQKLRHEINCCKECDVCRSLMDDCCLVFPRMYKLLDEKREIG
ncbi:hypothetical protein ACFL2Q_17385 [Thermodesulfobacteriota bacterium]